ncbi:extracellular ligand-binding receptor [Desulfosarcina variabilis str. Montpellier]|uniref:penicillin-binding protein activator n=1 Tax=Desulfosarcina variabilis TaxID=2300 RepID=UPI003AFA3154
MQNFFRCFFFLILVAMAGCAPTPKPTPMPPTATERLGHPLFTKAEQAFDKGQYAEALNIYNTFLDKAYNDPAADAALFKVGKIFQLTGRSEDALAVFLRLTHEFPQSELVCDAILARMSILFERENFDTVVNVGLAYLETADPKVHRTPFYAIIADAYEAKNARLDAAHYRYQAFVNATEEEQSIAWDNLQKSVEQLSAVEIQALVAQVTDRRIMGALLYRLGMALIMEEKYDEAIDVLSAFVDKFPSHPDRQDASDIIVSLEERSRFTPFKVGCVLPLSGPFGLFGRRALDGVEFAFSIISETAQDLPFQIIVKDSRSDPKIGANAFEDLDQQKVGAILGPMSISDTVAEIAQKRGMPIIVFTQKEGVTDSGPYVFRNFITPQMQVQALVDFAVDELGVDRFAVLYPDEHYGRRYMNLFWDQVVDHGRVINGVETYNPEGTDFATPIKKLTGIYYTIPRDLVKKSMPHPIDLPLSFINDDPINGQSPHIDVDLLPVLSGIPLDHEFIDALGRRNVDRDDQWHPIVDFDAIFIPDAPKKAGLVIPQLAYYDIRDVYLLGTNLWNSQTLLDMSKDYMKSTLIVDGFFANSQNPHTKAFVDDFKRVYNRMPGIIEAVAYDSTMMVFQTMRQTASDLRRDIKQALSQISDFNGVSGRTSFTANGEAQKTMTMLRIQKGRFVEAKVESSAAGDISQH